MTCMLFQNKVKLHKSQSKFHIMTFYIFAHLKVRATTMGVGLLNLSVTRHSFQEQKH